MTLVMPPVPDNFVWKIEDKGMLGLRIRLIQLKVRTQDRKVTTRTDNPKYTGKWWSLQPKTIIETLVETVTEKVEVVVAEEWLDDGSEWNDSRPITEDEILESASNMLRKLEVMKTNSTYSGYYGS